MSLRCNRRSGFRLEALEDRVNLSPPTVTGVQIGDGTIQRSIIRSVTVTFSEAVTFIGTTANAFQMHRDSAPPFVINDPPPSIGNVNCAAVQAGPTVTLTFLDSGPNPIPAQNGSLPDGRYTMTISAMFVTGADGQLDGNGDGLGGDNYVLASAAAPYPPTNIFRFFGDVTGDGNVSAADFNGTGATGTPPNVIGFRQSFGGTNLALDFDGDGTVSAADFRQFRLRFGGSVP